MHGTKRTRPILMYLVTEDWYFLSHRLPMALAAKRAGYDVHVATRVNRGGAEIARLGFTLHPLSWQRGSLNPVRLLSVIRDIRYDLPKIRPRYRAPRGFAAGDYRFVGGNWPADYPSECTGRTRLWIYVNECEGARSPSGAHDVLACVAERRERGGAGSEPR